MKNVKNSTLLSAGKKIYEKKKSKKQDQLLEVKFDEDAREKFLTGFSKRKQERRNHAIKKVKEQERLDKIEERKMRKDHILQQIREKQANFVAQFGEEEEEEGVEGNENAVEEMKFGTGDDSTTVTVMTQNLDDEDDDSPAKLLRELKAKVKSNMEKEKAEAEEAEQEEEIDTSDIRLPSKPKKFRYESKGERKKAQLKEKMKKKGLSLKQHSRPDKKGRH